MSYCQRQLRDEGQRNMPAVIVYRISLAASPNRSRSSAARVVWETAGSRSRSGHRITPEALAGRGSVGSTPGPTTWVWGLASSERRPGELFQHLPEDEAKLDRPT